MMMMMMMMMMMTTVMMNTFSQIFCNLPKRDECFSHVFLWNVPRLLTVLSNYYAETK